MKRLQISLEEELDEALAVESARRGLSKAAVIREALRAALPDRRDADPFADLIGDIDEEPGDIDEVVYGA